MLGMALQTLARKILLDSKDYRFAIDRTQKHRADEQFQHTNPRFELLISHRVSFLARTDRI